MPRSKVSLPNVIIVSFDALRRDFLSMYEKSGVSVPLFERAQISGVKFLSAFTSGNWTVPSHASLFSGLEPQLHKVFNWFEALPAESLTLFSDAKKLGYKCAFLASSGVRPIASQQDKLFEIFGPTNDQTEDEISLKTGGWFVFWHFLHTHAPYGIKAPRTANPQFVDMDLKDKDLNYIREMVCSDRVPEIRRAILRNLSDAADRVEAMWDRLGENTIVVLLSDHGEDWRPYFSFHCSFEEPVIKIPMLVSAPGFAKTDDPSLIAHSDIVDMMRCLIETDENNRWEAYQKWRSISAQKNRVVIVGPDGFNNDECYVAVRDRNGMLVSHPNRLERMKYIIKSDKRCKLLSSDADKGLSHLEEMVEVVLEELYQIRQDSIKLEEDDALLDRLKALGYL